jgi:peptide-methionine (S)-S-oxide reductase
MFFDRFRPKMIEQTDALAGRETPGFDIPSTHEVLGTPMQPPFPAGIETAVFGMGCFWGAERIFWQTPGVYSTAAGYAGGFTPNPTYKEVCSGQTGHTEVVLVAFDPAKVSYEELLRRFWESHDPTQGMRQGADVGTQYRSAIYTTSAPPPRPAATPISASSPPPGTARSPRKFCPPARSTTPRTTTSNTWRRCRAVTAASAAPE